MSDAAASPVPDRAETPGAESGTLVPDAPSPAPDQELDVPDAPVADAQADAANDLQADLFGDDDDEEEQIQAPTRANGNRAAEEDSDDEDAGVRRQTRRARQRLGSDSASPEPAGAQESRGVKRPSPSPARSSSPARRISRSRSPASSTSRRSQDLDEEAIRQLEYKEEDDAQPDENVVSAYVSLPQMPVRRTKEHWMARIPHFLRYVTEPFDAETWDDEDEERMLQEEGFTTGFSHDSGAVSLLRTSNTVRWRYTNQVDEDGARIPESNARIVRWSDGTMSLQVGRELFDITQQTEGGRVSASNGTSTPQSEPLSQGPGPSSQPSQSRPVPMGGAGSTRPAQSLSYLVVPQLKAEVMETEGPIAGSLAFTPADTRSETHMRIAKALRFQKTARVVATDAGEGARDPELEKQRIEKELKDAEKRRIRERQKADRKSGKFDDEFDVDTRRRGGRPVTGRKSGAGPRNTDYWSDESEAMSVDGDATEERGGPGRGLRQTRGDAKRAAAGEYADEDDGFIVNDEEDGYSRKKKRSAYESDGMDIDDEPDAMEIAEAKIEEQERARKKAASSSDGGAKLRAPVLSDDDEDAEGEDEPAAASQAEVKKKRIIESDEE